MVAEELGKTPDALLERPGLHEDLTDAYIAYQQLSACRTIGAHFPNPISFVDIVAYHDFMELDYDKEEFIRYLLSADSAFFEHMSERAKDGRRPN